MPCEGNTISTEGSSSCTPCETGTVINEERTECGNYQFIQVSKTYSTLLIDSIGLNLFLILTYLVMKLLKLTDDIIDITHYSLYTNITDTSHYSLT